jgi:hypothetical protein
MTRNLFLAIALTAGVASLAPAQAAGLLGIVREAISSNVSDPRDDEAVQAERDYYDRQSRDERQPDSAVRAEQEYYDSQTRAERDYYASQSR